MFVFFFLASPSMCVHICWFVFGFVLFGVGGGRGDGFVCVGVSVWGLAGAVSEYCWGRGTGRRYGRAAVVLAGEGGGRCVCVYVCVCV